MMLGMDGYEATQKIRESNAPYARLKSPYRDDRQRNGERQRTMQGNKYE